MIYGGSTSWSGNQDWPEHIEDWSWKVYESVHGRVDQSMLAIVRFDWSSKWTFNFLRRWWWRGGVGRILILLNRGICYQCLSSIFKPVLFFSKLHTSWTRAPVDDLIRILPFSSLFSFVQLFRLYCLLLLRENSVRARLTPYSFFSLISSSR